MADVAGMKLDEFCQRVHCELNAQDRERIFHQTRDAAYEIIQRKGSTFYAVAVGLLRIVESILRDQHTVLTVSSLVPGHYGIKDVYLSLPSVIGRHGVEHVLHLPLDAEERQNLCKSAAVLADVLGELRMKN
jgi:L-lactate dehydrogenase